MVKVMSEKCNAKPLPRNVLHKNNDKRALIPLNKQIN